MNYNKIILIIIFLLIASIGNAKSNKKKLQQEEIDRYVETEFSKMQENVVLEGNTWVFTKVVELPGVSATDIYSAVSSSLAELLTDANDAIKEKDKDTGNIIAKITYLAQSESMKFGYWIKRHAHSTVMVSIKDGKYRIKLILEDISRSSNNKYVGDVTSTPADYYPYWKECEPKNRKISFDVLKEIYNSSLGILHTIEAKIAKQIAESDW